MILKLKIDGATVDIDQKTNIAATHSIADIQEPGNSSAGYSKSVELPFTPRNMAAFRFTNEVYSKEQFNNELHTAEYLVDDHVVISGVAQIEKITCKYGTDRKLLGGSFHVSVIGSAFEWITSAKRPINALESDEGVIYTLDRGVSGNVYDNSISQEPSLIKFFPVDRGAFWVDSADKKTPRRTLDLRDYHPFVNVKKLLTLLFSGYELRTSLQNTFSKLYFSGAIPESEDTSYVQEGNDFKAGSTLSGEMMYGLGANNSYTQEFNLFDTWDSAVNSEYFEATPGILIAHSAMHPYTTFKPTEKCRVGFNVTLSLTTSVGGFGSDVAAFTDTLILGEGSQSQSVAISPDSSEEAKGRLTEIPLDTGAKTLVFARLDTSIYRKITMHYTTYRGVLGRKVLVNNLKPAGQWFVIGIPHSIESGDFITVTGIVAEEEPREDAYGWYYPGQSLDKAALDISIIPIPETTLTFKNTLALSGYNLTSGSDRVLLRTAFSCSERKDVRFQLGEGFLITPTFGSYIGFGDKIGIATVGGESTQLEFLGALRQMFNLMFYTNSLTREVIIEPRTAFYRLDKANVVDWRDKIDYMKPIEIVELGADVGNALRLAYADGNDVVQYYNWKNKADLGAYTTPLLNKIADETKEVANPIFAPFLLRNVESVGMTIPQEKRENTQDTIDDVELEITPIVGYFAGINNRTAGSDVAAYPRYPQLAFQDTAKGINLGFDDIVGESAIAGLRYYYRDNISAYNYGKRITLYLQLDSQDVEAIQQPNPLMRDFRAVYLLNIEGEDVPCLLESIADYNPAGGGATKCQFISDPNMKLTGNDLVVITCDDVAIGRNNTVVGCRE